MRELRRYLLDMKEREKGNEKQKERE